MKRIVVMTGGHLAPALAVIEEIRKSTDWDIVWIGRKYAMEGENISSIEADVIPKLDIPFYTIDAGRLQRKWTNQTIPSLLRIPLGFYQSLILLLKLKPGVVMSFGGYLSLPVVFAGWLLRIPIVSHEQTVVSGLANRLAGFFADNILISFQGSSLDFPHHKTILVGNPVRRSVLEVKRKVARPKLIYVTGGNQGSQIINKTISAILPKILTSFQVIHQTGQLDYKTYVARKRQLKMARRYKVFANLDPAEIPKILARASLVISRAGANTVSEISAVGVSAIFIPIPWSERGEQEKNARMLARIGIAKVIQQDRLTPKSLLGALGSMIDKPPNIRQVARAKRLINHNASQEIVKILRKFIERE
mgnify:CR=1 FL=1